MSKTRNYYVLFGEKKGLMFSGILEPYEFLEFNNVTNDKVEVRKMVIFSKSYL